MGESLPHPDLEGCARLQPSPLPPLHSIPGACSAGTQPRLVAQGDEAPTLPVLTLPRCQVFQGRSVYVASNSLASCTETSARG